MRYLFFGAGAIGTYIGGSLAAAGEPVAFLERPEMAALLRRDGLQMTIAGRTTRIPDAAAYSSAAEALRAGGSDVIVFALKSFDTGTAVETLVPLRGGLPPALCLQNGVENEAALEAAFGRENVIAGSVTSAVGRDRVGSITLERKRGIGIAAGHALSAGLREDFRRAGLNARLYPSAPALKWSKMLTNLIANASAAIVGWTPRRIYADPRLFLLEREMLRECLRVMRSGGIAVTDLPGTPVRALAFAVERLPAPLSRPVLLRAVGGGRGAKMPSFFLDLDSGRGKSEVDWLNGAVSRAGRRLRISTPVNDLLNATLQDLTGHPEGRVRFLDKPAELLSALAADDRRRIGLA
jgi:2-dehydropantoate 2-reductase